MNGETCDVIEPGDGKPYERDPRSLARRAEAYLKSSGVGDAAFFGPEPEFFIFDQVQWGVDMSGSYVKIGSEEASWSTGATIEGGNMGHRPAVKGGYFPVPPVDSTQDMRAEMSPYSSGKASIRPVKNAAFATSSTIVGPAGSARFSIRRCAIPFFTP